VNLVGRDKSVLDVGCSTGYMAEVLRDHFNCRVTGIEVDAEAAEKAREFCEDVLVEDIGTLDWDSHFRKTEYDVIVFADVLEHLTNPKHVLQEAKKYVKEAIIISVPNIAHASILYHLLQGRFAYRPLGILDDTHVRYFTKSSIVELIESSGFVAERIERTRIPPNLTEFQTSLDMFPKEIVSYIQSLGESDVYQYVIRAVPAGTQPGEVLHSDRDFAEQISEKEGRINGLLEELRDARSALQEANSKIAELEEGLETKDEELQGLAEKVSEAENQSQKLREDLGRAEERIGWYGRKLREQLKTHYLHNTEREKLQATLDALAAESPARQAEIEEIRRVTIAGYPPFLRMPLKAFGVLISEGPSAVIGRFRARRQKKK